MRPHLDDLLPHIVASPDYHARWLNTFSFLEYIGFRKIIKSQQADQLSLEILGHAVEEGRHALLLKKLAVKLGGPSYDRYAPATLLCPDEAETYFQALDQACAAALTSVACALTPTQLTYYYVTLLIELRALDVYAAYQSALAARGERPPLTGLLAEEDKHLHDVQRALTAADPAYATRLAEFRDIEATLYAQYLAALATLLNDEAQRVAS